MEEFLAGVKKNSRIPENDLETVVGEIGGAAADGD